MKIRGSVSFFRTPSGSYSMKVANIQGHNVVDVEMSVEEFALIPKALRDSLNKAFLRFETDPAVISKNTSEE